MSFATGSGGCRRTCDGCGREWFTTESGYDWEEGEFEDLVEKRRKYPDEYKSSDYTISTYRVNGKECVMDCPCNYGGRYEKFIRSHCVRITDYLKRTATIEIEKLKGALAGTETLQRNLSNIDPSVLEEVEGEKKKVPRNKRVITLEEP